MTKAIIDTVGAFRASFTTGLVTGVVAGTGTLGHIFAARWQNTTRAKLLKAIEVEAIVTTAFTAAQEVGIDFVRAAITDSHTGGTALSGATLGGKKRTTYDASAYDAAGSLRIATTGALAAGAAPAPTLDAYPFAKTSFYASAIGAQLYRKFDFATIEPGGQVFIANQGLVARNVIAMGAVGVVRWTVTFDWEEVVLGN